MGGVELKGDVAVKEEGYSSGLSLRVLAVFFRSNKAALINSNFYLLFRTDRTPIVLRAASMAPTRASMARSTSRQPSNAGPSASSSSSSPFEVRNNAEGSVQRPFTTLTKVER
jgi:hypothetical protein